MQTNGKHFESSINLRRIPDMWHIQFNPVEYIDFGDVINVAVEVWSWKLCQIKDSLAFDAAICGSVNQLYTATARCFDSLNRRLQRQRPMNLDLA